MSSKKKTHPTFFTPHLQKGEDLLWVDTSSILWRGFSFKLALFLAYLFWTAFMWSMDGSGVLLCIFPLLFTFLYAFTAPVQSFYAISNKRLFIQRRYFLFNWNMIESHSLMLLPEFRLFLEEKKRASIDFAPFPIPRSFWERMETGDRPSDTVISPYESLSDLSHDSAQTAYNLLMAAKEERLEEHARKLGLME